MDKYGESNDPRLDQQSMQDLRNKAEEAKKILTTKETYKTVVSFNQQQEKIELTRKKFEELTKDLLNRTIELSKLLLENAKQIGHPQVDTFLMVGGSSRMPMVRAAIESDLHMDPKIFEPDMAVAKGAAIIGYYKKQLLKPADGPDGDTGQKRIGPKAIEFNNITSKAFGVVLTRREPGGQDENYVYFILPRHTKLPAEKNEKGFGTYASNQRSVKIDLMEQADGNSEPSEILNNNISIGSGTIEGLPPNLPANSPIEITFQIKDDGTLALHASCLGKECHINAQVSGVMNEKELADAIRGQSGMTIT
jgi:molecular chaperone DnaK